MEQELTYNENKSDNILVRFYNLFKSKLVEKENTASDAYLKSKYNYRTVPDENKRFDNLIRSINESIERNIANNNFYCTNSIKEDMMKYKDKIIQHYLDLGFTCIWLNERVKEITENILFISWINKY